jgi:hypothetical protein
MISRPDSASVDAAMLQKQNPAMFSQELEPSCLDIDEDVLQSDGKMVDVNKARS